MKKYIIKGNIEREGGEKRQKERARKRERGVCGGENGKERGRWRRGRRRRKVEKKKRSQESEGGGREGEVRVSQKRPLHSYVKFTVRSKQT